jgi:hypothetical protein
MEHSHAISTIFFSLLSLGSFAQPLVCDPAGNVIVYSGYDGGLLTIDVDEDIPDLKIGVLAYNAVRIVIGGDFVGNVTAVHYAGYNGDGGDYCQQGVISTTSIQGVPNNIEEILLYPPATLANAFGSSDMVCNYSCSITTSQGGCNTADQTEDYFRTVLGGEVRFHFTQYACFNGPYLVSGGGNCCATDISTTVAHEAGPLTSVQVYPQPAGDLLYMKVQVARPMNATLEILDAQGRVLRTAPFASQGSAVSTVPVADLATGRYLLRLYSAGQQAVQAFDVVH